MEVLIHNLKIISIQTGKKVKYKKKDRIFESSYIKTKASLPQRIDSNGFIEDTQSDTVHHGGEPKAIMAFCYENYELIKKYLGIRELNNGEHGENLTISGLDEKTAFLGSIYTVGEVVLEISQPREPCWKVSYFLDHKNGMKYLFESGLTGWYFRVLKSGVLKKNDQITLTKQGDTELSIEILNKLVNKKLKNPKLLEKAINSQALGEPFKKSLRDRCTQ